MKGRIRSRRKQRKSHLKFQILRSLLWHLLLLSSVAPSDRVTGLYFVAASSPITASTPQENKPPRVRFSEKFAPTEDTIALNIQANNTTATRNVNLRDKSDIDILPAEVFPIDTTTVNADFTDTNTLATDLETLNTTAATSKLPKTDTFAASIILQTNKTKISSLHKSRPSVFKTGALAADQQSVDTTNLYKDTPVTQTTDRDSVDIQSITEKIPFSTSLATTPSNYTVGADLLHVNSSKSLLPDTMARHLHNISTRNSTVSATLAGNLSTMPVNKSFTQTTVKSTETSLDPTNSSIQVSSTLLSMFKYPSNNSNYVFVDNGLSMSKNLPQGPTAKQTKSLLAFETFRRYNLSLEEIRASKSPTSCSNRCGEDTSYPCSCDEKCVVHKTCCHDLVVTCPDVYSLAMVKFRHLLSASVRCDTMTSVLMVQSCPKIKDNGNPIQKTLINNKHSQNNYSGEKIMFDILSNVPIIDYDTGIIFSNASIYECNQQTKSFNFSQTLAASTNNWVIQIGISPKAGYITNNQQKLDLSTYSYIPPESPLITSASLCYTQDTLSCISELFAEFSIQETLCNTSVSQYYKTRGTISSHYDRIAEHICDLCLFKYQKSAGLEDRFYLSGFRVMMSMSTSPGYAVYRVPTDFRRYTQPVPWLSWTCKISDQMDLEASKSCRVLQCDPRFLLTEGGLCRKGALAEFSVQEEVLFKGKICRINPHAFARAAQCYTKTFQLKATAKPYRHYKVYNQRARINATVVRAEMFFDTPTFEDQIMAFGRSYDTFYASMLVFAQKYCLSKEEKAKHRSTTHDNLFGPSIKKTFRTSRNTNADRGEIFLYAKDFKLSQMYERFFFKVCLQTGSVIEELEDGALGCNFNSEALPIGQEITINDLVATVEDSRCVQVDVLKSDAVRVSLSLIVSCFSVMTTSLTVHATVLVYRYLSFIWTLIVNKPL
ncbi:hypothetical protein ElyMa_003958200 [Elysia marginata]|uniref:SMB domain-containing protein n=1 Tax=Elysia marginata TaxID=1093978 RepID=A0AAV4FWD1_9GAST|nr:hypothetical protein ElyMa_003958200 [Elysia marginata]